MKLTKPFSLSRRLRIGAPLIIGLVAIASSTNSSADDGKLFPGNNCITRSDHYVINALRENANSISNTSTRNSLYVRCPIIRDYMSASTGIKKVRIFFKNANPQARMSCSLQVRNGDGSLRFIRSGHALAGNYEGEFTINVNQAGGYKTSYSIGCRIPPALSQTNLPTIKAYRVDEYN
jgi:hypothetical protein